MLERNLSIWALLAASLLFASASRAGSQRLTCDASPGYPKWSFGYALTGKIKKGQVNGALPGGFVGTDLVLERGAIKNAGNKNALLERLDSKCMLNATGVTLSPSDGKDAYIQSTTFDGGDTRPTSPLAVRIQLRSEDGNPMCGPVFKDVQIASGTVSFETPITHFAENLVVENMILDMADDQIQFGWKEILSGMTIGSSLRISVNYWKDVDLKALQTAVDLGGKELDLRVSTCRGHNGDETCFKDTVPVAALHAMVYQAGLKDLRIQSSQGYPYYTCVTSNIRELCADPLLRRITTPYEMNEYGFAKDFTCDAMIARCAELDSKLQ